MADEQYEIYESGTAAALAEWQLAALADKPDGTAYAPDLTAGAALGITGEATDSAAWLQRVSTSDGPTTAKSVKGNTLVWNQLFTALTFNFSGTSYDIVADGTGKWTVTVNEGGTSADGSNISAAAIASATFTAGHKYLITSKNANIALYLKAYYVQANTIFTASEARFTNVSVLFSNLAAGTYVLYPQLFDLTQMFGAGNEPSTVAEFEALFPLPYYEYDAGSLLSVNMEGLETVGFNQWDEEWKRGAYNNDTGLPVVSNVTICNVNPIPVFPLTTYAVTAPIGIRVFEYDAEGNFLHTSTGHVGSNTFTTTAQTHLLNFQITGTTYNHDICINLSWSGRRNGEYEPYWSSQREIAAATYFPDGMRSAGSVRDELTSTEAITRVGVVDLGTLSWSLLTGGTYNRFVSTNLVDTIKPSAQASDMPNCIMVGYEAASFNDVYNTVSDRIVGVTNEASGARGTVNIVDSGYSTAADFKSAMSGVLLFYELKTPTVTPIDPALNLSYRVDDFGTERVMVPTGENSAPPTIVTAHGYTAESLRDAALSAIAPVENELASTNYAVGAYLVHGGHLCKVTTAIATGEAISIGTNVTATTVMAEVIALIAQ